jgi:tetratricopeptide (TPR) repeat protein
MPNKRRSVRQVPTQETTPPYALFIHSLAAMGDERYEEAITALQKYLILERNSLDQAAGLQNLATCLMETEQYVQALDILNQLETLMPHTPAAQFLRGVILARSGNFSESQALFDIYACQQPRLARQMKLKETQDLLKAIIQGKKAPGAFLAEQLQTYLSLNIDFGDYTLVEQKARQIIAADPGRPEGHFALGVAYIEFECYTEAIAAFQEALRLNPEHVITLYNIGYTWMKMNEPAQAVPWLEKAVRQDGGYIGAWEQLGRAYQQTSRIKEAISAWKKGLKLEPGSEIFLRLLHESGAGPALQLEEMPPYIQQYQEMVAQVQARMHSPEVFHSANVTLTVENKVGFTLEDSQNPANITVYAGGPFEFGHISDGNLLDFMGGIKLAIRMVGGENTREVAVLVYYQNGTRFHYKTHIERGKRVEHNAEGRFSVTEIPNMFKVRMIADFVTPFGNPMCGRMIYLRQGDRSGVIVNTLGRESAKRK